MTYSEKLRDPRWQKKRLELLALEQFKCSQCGDGSTELQIHHVNYDRGTDPWDYPEENYRVYCVKCHRKTEQNIKLVREWVCHSNFNEPLVRILLKLCPSGYPIGDLEYCVRELQWIEGAEMTAKPKLEVVTP